MSPGRKYRRRYRKRNVSQSVKKYVKSAIHRQVENKHLFVDMAATFNSISTTWTEVDMSTVAQGGTAGNRIGRETLFKSVYGKFLLTGADTTNIIRVVVMWVYGTSTTPLTTAGATLNSAIVPSQGVRNFLVKKLYDKYFHFSQTTDVQKLVKFYCKVNRRIIYGDDSTSYPNRRLIVSMLSDSGAVTHPYVACGHLTSCWEDA